jgi:hypothetical protein
LSLADGSLMLEDAKTAIGKLDPLTRFGSSAFGPVHVRAMSADGVTGDWIPLGTLVRIPEFKELKCPHAASKPCTLTGTDLFLAASIGATANQDDATDVPADFTGTQLSVPHPVNGTLYLWLRDDPETMQTLNMAVMPIGPTSQAAGTTAQQPTAGTGSSKPAAETPEGAGSQPSGSGAGGAPAGTSPAPAPGTAPATSTTTEPASKPQR